MPKLKNEREERNRNTQAEIDRWLKRKGLTKQDFGRVLGVSKTTGYDRYNHTEKLTVADLRMMKLPDDVILEIVK